MNDSDGARFDLRLQTSNAEHAVYSVRYSLTESIIDCEARVDCQTGEVNWGNGPSPDAPQWLVKYATTALRTAWRAREADGWPRRLTRWRSLPKAAANRSSKPPSE